MGRLTIRKEIVRKEIVRKEFARNELVKHGIVAKASRLFCLSLLLLGGCKQGSVQAMVPAVLFEASHTSRQEIQAHIAEALGGTEVLLADDALTQTSDLIIERSPQRDPQGNRLPGRIIGEPDRFRLGLQNSRCVLLHINSGRHWVLQDSRCVAKN